MRLPFAPSDNADQSGAVSVKTKRKRRRSPGGLGRNLARILTDSQDGTPGPRPRRGLVQLVGGETVTRVTEIERFVVDAALRAVVEGFGLDGMVIAAGPGPDRPDEPPVVCSQLPPSWSADSGVLLAVYGNLWPLLDRDAPPTPRARRHWEIPVEGHRIWLHRTVKSDRPLVAAAIRSTPLGGAEGDGLADIVGALAGPLAGGGAGPALRQSIMEATTISLKSEGADVLAEVNADWTPPVGVAGARSGRRTGVGRGADPVIAVARAAAKACRPRCEVAFAGATELDDGDVAVALVQHQRDGLRLGYALRPRGDLGGVAEAVFTAAL